MAEKEPQFLYITTTGWKTRKPHEIEIWYVGHEGAYYLVSEWREKSHWVQNIQHNPIVSFRVDDKTFQGKGRVIDNEAEPTLAAAVSTKMDEKYEWSDGLIVELRPD